MTTRAKSKNRSAHRPAGQGINPLIGIALLLLSVIVLLIIAAGYVNQIQIDSAQIAAFDERADTTQGTIEALGLQRTRRFIPGRRYITYEYTVGNTTYTAEQDVSDPFWTTLEENAPITVEYLPDEPARSRIEHLDSRGVYGLIVAVLGIGIALLLWRVYMLAQRMRH